MFKYLKKYWLYVVLAPLFMIGEVLMDLVQPGMMSTIVDEGVLGLSNNNVGDLSIVISVGVRMIGVVFLGGSFGVAFRCLYQPCKPEFWKRHEKRLFWKDYVIIPGTDRPVLYRFPYYQSDK